jgi:hypothetical protein
LIGWLLAPCAPALAGDDIAKNESTDREREDGGFGVEVSARWSNRASVKLNFLDLRQSFSVSQSQGRQGVTVDNPLNLSFDKDEIGYSTFAQIRADVRTGTPLGASLTIDSGELKFPPLMYYHPPPDCSEDDLRCQITANGRAVADEARSTAFVRELYLSAGLGTDGWFSLRGGKLLLSAGNGYILDNYALGVEATLDLDLGYDVPLKIEIDGIFPNGDFTSSGKRSPFLYLDVAYPFSFFEEVGLFFAFFHDGDDNVAEIVRSITLETLLNSPGFSGGDRSLLVAALQMAEITSRGNLFWVGARGNWLFERATLSATAMVEFGSFSTTIRVPRTGSFPGAERSGAPSCLGGMLDVGFHIDLTESLTLGAFFLFLSGETFSKDEIGAGVRDRYGSFIAVYPYITRTNLFFSGGMNENFSARSFSTSGVNGRGVLAPGLSAGLDLGEDVTLRLISALLFSHGEQLASGEHFYGFETDLNLSWRIGTHVQVLAEADVFTTGGFFEFEKPLEADPARRVFTKEPAVWKFLLGLDLSL